jgi:hypothetical protein
MWIQLPHGKPGEGFYVQELVDQIRRSGRDRIIQGQVNCSFADHKKPSSLDYWIRENWTERKDTKQAVNTVIEELVATGFLTLHDALPCPDTGKLCKGFGWQQPSDHMADSGKK